MKILLHLFLFAAAFTVYGLNLADGGKSSYVIRLPENPTEMEQLAARELAEYVKKSTGAELKTAAAGSPAVILQRDPALQSEESRVEIKGKDLVLSGGDEWGVLYAVYEFLENQMGVRWFNAYGGEKVPKYQKLDLDFKAYTKKPAFAFRGGMNSYNYQNRKAAAMFFFRNRMNYMRILDQVKLPGVKTKYYPRSSAHSLFYYIPVRKGHYPKELKFKEEKYYFDEHPEYYSMDRHGKRVTNLQLCFGNKELRKEFTRRFCEAVEIRGTSGHYSVSSMDWPGSFCYCPECKKLEEKYQCTMGPLLDYLIELCNLVKVKYPDIYITTLAYRKKQSEFPPVMEGKLPDNLVISFAPIDDDFSKTYLHKNNAETFRNIKGWTKLAKHVELWYYPLPYGERLPFGGTERAAEDTRLLYEAGVDGVIYEHDVGVFQGLNFTEIMTWVMIRMFRDPYEDYLKLSKEFCDFYYGKASDDVFAYMKEMDRFTKEFPGFHVWNAGGMRTALTAEHLYPRNKMFDRMEAATADDSFANGNVKDMRITHDIALLFQWQALNKKHPGEIPAIDVIEKRVRKSLDAALVKRIPEERMFARDVYRKKIIPMLELSLLYATANPKPLPPPFDKLPAEKVRQVFPPKDKRKPDSVVVDPDAAFGYGVYYPKKPLEMPFTFGIYDNSAQKFVMSRTLTSDQIVPDKYHFYKVGDYAFSANSLVWTKGSWGVCVNMSDFYIAGEDPNKKYEVWISIKFEGPGYSKRSKKEKDRALVDRVIAVEK